MEILLIENLNLLYVIINRVTLVNKNGAKTFTLTRLIFETFVGKLNN